MKLSDYLRGLKKRELTDSQKNNVAAILKISEKFHRDAGLKTAYQKIDAETFVVESGHQPNFFPHAGTFRKAYLIGRIAQMRQGSVALYGFADYNLSTAPVLYQSRVPSSSKEGYINWGYKIRKEDRFKRFNTLPKPAPEAFGQQMQAMEKIYNEAFKEISEDLYTCYERAKTASDLNAFIYAVISSRLSGSQVLADSQVHFFRYSDVQKEGIVLNEAMDILSQVVAYNSSYNAAASEGLSGIKPVQPDSIPFWLHCGCGGKAGMKLSGETIESTCPLCKKDLSFQQKDFALHFPEMSLNAVSRNVIYSQALGSHLFVSGTGGSMTYGKISSRITKDLGYVLPEVIAWKARDFYSEPVQRRVISELMRLSEAHSTKDIPAAVKAKIEELTRAASFSSDKKEAQKYLGQATSLQIQAESAKNICSLTPSFIDLLASEGKEKITAHWDQALSSSPLEKEGGILILKSEIIYSLKVKETCEGVSGI